MPQVIAEDGATVTYLTDDGREVRVPKQFAPVASMGDVPAAPALQPEPVAPEPSPDEITMEPMAFNAPPPPAPEQAPLQAAPPAPAPTASPDEITMEPMEFEAPSIQPAPVPADPRTAQQQAAQMQEESILTQSEEAQKKEAQLQGVYDQGTAAFKSSIDREKEITEQYQQTYDAQEAKVEQAQKELVGSKVDPNQYWSDMSGARKAGVLVAVALTEMGDRLQGRQGGNAALGMLQKNIDRNVASQMEQINKLRDQVGFEQSRLGRITSKFQTQTGIEQTLRAAGWQWTEMRANAILNSTSDAAVKARAQQAIGEARERRAGAERAAADAEARFDHQKRMDALAARDRARSLDIQENVANYNMEKDKQARAAAAAAEANAPSPTGLFAGDQPWSTGHKKTDEEILNKNGALAAYDNALKHYKETIEKYGEAVDDGVVYLDGRAQSTAGAKIAQARSALKDHYREARGAGANFTDSEMKIADEVHGGDPTELNISNQKELARVARERLVEGRNAELRDMGYQGRWEPASYRESKKEFGEAAERLGNTVAAKSAELQRSWLQKTTGLTPEAAEKEYAAYKESGGDLSELAWATQKGQERKIQEWEQKHGTLLRQRLSRSNMTPEQREKFIESQRVRSLGF